MSLLNPWALMIGAAALALPVLIHWLTRPRPRTLPLSTIRFVREAVQQRRARHRLRDLLILLLRTAAVFLLAWAFSRPLAGSRDNVVENAGDGVRVVILDQSQSMAAATDGVQAFERGRAAAAKHLGFAPGLRANLILAAARPRAIFPAPSTNFPALRDALAPAQPSSQQLDLRAAIEQAAGMFAGLPEGTRKELVIVSDFQRSNWAAADFSALPKETKIGLESVGASQTPANLAILRVAAQGRVEQLRQTRLEVEVGNYSATPRQAQVDVSVGGATLRLSGACPPGMRTVLSGETVLPRAGWQSGSARLAAAQDALSADDVRPFALEVRPTPSYALITREDRKPRPTSSHFLERALAPIVPRENRSQERVVRVDPNAVDRDAVGASDLIVLDHPGRLSPESLRMLASLLRRGRPMLYVAAEPADATNLALLAEAAAPNLRLPVQFAAPPSGQMRSGLFIAEFRRDDPLFGVFGDGTAASLAPLRFAGGLSTRKVEGGLADDILATYSDQSAALIVTRCGAGTLAILNASLADSNLPGSSVFVPLIGELAGRLMSRNRGSEAVPSGDLLVSELPPEAGVAAGLTLTSSTDAEGKPLVAADALGALAEESGNVIWRWDSAGPPGVYTVRRGDADVFAVATATPAGESDLAAMDPKLLKGRLAGGRTISYRSAGVEDESAERDTRWTWFAVACAGCLMLELLVLKAFRT